MTNADSQHFIQTDFSLDPFLKQITKKIPSEPIHLLLITMAGQTVSVSNLDDRICIAEFSHGPDNHAHDREWPVTTGNYQLLQEWLQQQQGTNVVCYLDAFPNESMQPHFWKEINKVLSDEDWLFVSQLHSLWHNKIKNVRRFLNLTQPQNLQESEELLAEGARFATFLNDDYKKALSLLQTKPFLFAQHYQENTLPKANHQNTPDQLVDYGFEFDEWLRPQTWEKNVLKKTPFEKMWGTLPLATQIDLIEWIITPQIEALYQKKSNPQKKQILDTAPLTAEKKEDEKSANQETSEKVSDFYNVNPYPSISSIDINLDTRDMVHHLSHRCNGDRIPKTARTLIAGCGTIQAPSVAKGAPDASIIAIDVTPRSLAIAKKVSTDLNIKNLEFHQLDICDVDQLTGEFDTIISTGVLHHLKDPDLGLRKLASKLKTNGLMTLMVYNRYHRLHSIYSQYLLRHFQWAESDRVSHAKKLFKKWKHFHGLFRETAQQGLALLKKDEAMFADTFLHPQETSYDVPSLFAWLDQAGLRLAAFMNEALWSLDDMICSELLKTKMNQSSLQNKYELINLLDPPLLEFYAEKKSQPVSQRCCDNDISTFSKIVPKKVRFQIYKYDKKGVSQTIMLQPVFEKVADNPEQVKFYFADAGVFTTAHKIAKDFYELIDGQKSITDIAVAAGTHYGLNIDQTLPFAVDMFKRFFFRQKMATIAFCPGCQYQTET